MATGHIPKVAVLLGDHGVETLARARGLVQAVLAARPLGCSGTQVAIGLPAADGHEWHERAQRLAQDLPQVTVRRLAWERVPSGNVRRMFEPLDLPVSLAGLDRVTLPRDWGANFLDCDCWLVVSGTVPKGVYPARPTAVFCADLAQRRAPFAYARGMDAPFWSDQLAAFRLWRQSSAVVATDPVTAADLVSYAGIAPEKVIELAHPLDCDLPPQPAHLARASDTLLVRFEPDQRYAGETVLSGLKLYLAEGGGLHPSLAMEMADAESGHDTGRPGDVPAAQDLRDLLGDLRIERIASLADWARLLARHSRVWFPREHGGDGLMTRQALRSGARVLCADTPVQRRAHALAGGAATFYTARSAAEIADTLHLFEQAGLAAPAPAAARAPAPGRLALEIGFVLDRLREAVHA